MSQPAPGGGTRAWVPPEGWTPPEWRQDSFFRPSVPSTLRGRGAVPGAASLIALLVVLQVAGLAMTSARPQSWPLAAVLFDAADEPGAPTPGRRSSGTGQRGSEKDGPPNYVDREWAEKVLPKAGDLEGDWRDSDHSSGPRQGAMADLYADFDVDDDRVPTCALAVRAGTGAETAVAETNLRSESGGLVVAIATVYSDDGRAAADFEVLSGSRYVDCLRDSFEATSRRAAERMGVGIGSAGAEPMDPPIDGDDVAAVRVVAELATPEGTLVGGEVVVVRRGRAIVLVARSTAGEQPTIAELAALVAERMGPGPPAG